MTIRSVGIIGAGFAGLSTAKVLRAFGFEVTVFEKEPDVGGVWAASRRYPGLTTQNPRTTYALSDFPMPASYPEWPSGQQVQAYLQSYAEHFGLVPFLRMSTTVESAVLDEEAGVWTVQARRAATGQGGALPAEVYRFDYLVVCNGIFSEPAVPQYPGADAFVAAGGRVCHTSQFNDAGEARGNFRLYRSILPVAMPRLAFNGYNSSFFSQLNCEIGALWLANHLRGGQQLPPPDQMNAQIDRRLAWMEERTDGKHSKGTNIIPFSVHNIDELLQDMGLPLGVLTRFKQWLRPVDPSDYAVVTRQLLARHANATVAVAAPQATSGAAAS